MSYALTICINVLYIILTEFPAVSCYAVSYFRIQMREEVFILSCLHLEFVCYWFILRMMSIDKRFSWADLLTRFQYICNRKFGVNEVHEKFIQGFFLNGSLAHSHDKNLFWPTYCLLSGTYNVRIWGHMSQELPSWQKRFFQNLFDRPWLPQTPVNGL